MKSKTTLFALLAGLFLLAAFTLPEINSSVPEKGEFEIPENINAIFEKSCFGCHNSESDYQKAKDKMMIDKLGDLKKSKLVAKLNKIGKEVSEGEMPPEKFVAKYPDRVPTDAERQALVDWAKNAIKTLTKK